MDASSGGHGRVGLGGRRDALSDSADTRGPHASARRGVRSGRESGASSHRAPWPRRAVP